MSTYTPIISVGLENCGNSCFMNSAIQMLFAIDEFREFILQSSINKSQVLSALQNIFKLMKSSKSYVQSNSLINSFKILQKSYPENIPWGGQGDSQEFLSYLIDQVDAIKILFKCELDTSSYCKNNNNIITKEEVRKDPSLLISLDISKGNSLSDLIDQYRNVEKLDKSSGLSRCSQNNSYIENNIVIPKNNKYLFIQLQRSIYTQRGQQFVDKKINIEQHIKINNTKYTLLNVILRTGSNTSGHYINATYKDGKLFKVYNDAHVSQNLGNFTLDNHAYILVYIRDRDSKNNVNQNNIINKLNKQSSKINNNIHKKLAKQKEILEKEKKVITQHIIELQNKENIINEKIEHIEKINNNNNNNNNNNIQQIAIQINKNYKFAKRLSENNTLGNNVINNTYNTPSNNTSRNNTPRNNTPRNNTLRNNTPRNNTQKYSNQINKNYKFAQRLSENNTLGNNVINNTPSNNNEVFAKKLQQEFNNEVLAKKLQQEFNNEILARKLQNQYNKNIK